MEKAKLCLENILKLTLAKYKNDNALLQQEYEELEQVPPAPGQPGRQHSTMIKQKLCLYSCQNELKNRYSNLYPYDKHIFQFAKQKYYINASWIDFKEDSGSKYIITMGPIHPSSYRNPDGVLNTCGDFWKMCWESKGRVIVMLCCVSPGFSGCSQYFPGDSSTQQYRSITVTHESDVKDPSGSFIERKFTLTKNNEKREIYHQHFLWWPNYGVPSPDDLCKFLLHVRKRSAEINGDQTTDSPYLIIHCSGGVGRSGAFLASFVAYSKLMKLINELKNGDLDNNIPEDAIALKDLVWTMRTQRHPWMVEGLHQYKLVYDVFIKQLNALIKENEV